MHRLPSRDNDARLLAAIQCATLQILLGTHDSTIAQSGRYAGQGRGKDGAVEDIDRGRDVGAFRAGNQGISEVNNNGGSSASIER